MDLFQRASAIAIDPRQTRWIAPILLAADVALCGLIIWKVPYTEIDWKAYMDQVTQFASGERNYVKIRGGTGPLVYPAIHVYIYRVLYDLTDHGRNIKLAQYIFGVLYLATLTMVMACYRQARVPPYVFPMLILSKRLHSIFVLRLFNDCFAVFFFFMAIYLFQKRLWTAGSMVYSIGLGVKMSLLLSLPAVGIILFQALGAPGALRKAGIIAQLQVVTAWPFIVNDTQSYLSRAFEFTRAFLFKWTVNWRFVGEEVFLSRWFSLGLLTAHGGLLILFIATRWLKPSGQSLPDAVRAIFNPPSSETQALVASRVTPRYILTTMLTANAIGMLCARSLHYQFYSLIAWATPFLLWRSGMHPILQYLVWSSQEYAWNVYPSTSISSLLVVSALLVQVASIWVGAENETGLEKSKKRVE